MRNHHTPAGAFARTVGALALLVGTVAGASAVPGALVSADSNSTTIKLRDECEPVSFNAALGDGACIGDGDVTFEELLATLTPAIGGHDKWRQPESVGVKVGTTLHVVNRGGETHSFTEVFAFGTGFVPELNAALPPGTPPAIPVHGFAPLPARASTDVSGLSAGTHRFMCMIHPWMRTTVKVKTR